MTDEYPDKRERMNQDSRFRQRGYLCDVDGAAIYGNCSCSNNRVVCPSPASLHIIEPHTLSESSGRLGTVMNRDSNM